MDAIIREIRDFINQSRIQAGLLENPVLWNQLCSSLDAIRDTSNAIEAYLQYDGDDNYGEQILRVYGLLQALYVQQDAVKNLYEAVELKFDISPYPKLKEIRKLRNDAIGHPTKRGTNSNNLSFHFINLTIKKGTITILSNYQRKMDDFREIDVKDIINEQSKCISESLNKVLEELKSNDEQHRAKYRDKKLAGLFNETSYAFEKMGEAILDNRPLEFGRMGVQIVERSLKDLETALKKRGLDINTYDSIKEIYRLIKYPLSELQIYFNSKETTSINNETAYIFTDFLGRQIDELKEILAEIDEEYSN